MVKSESHPPTPSTLSTIFNLGVTATAYAGSTFTSYHRQLRMPKVAMPTKISNRVHQWCTSDDSVSAQLAKKPDLAPSDASESLYGSEGISISEKKPPKERVPATAEDLERAYQCGKFGPTRPSELFLRIFHDALVTLDHDPLIGCVSPSLMGSCGAIPLTVIAPLPDICRHLVRFSSGVSRDLLLTIFPVQFDCES
jgi:hypothetical protein